MFATLLRTLSLSASIIPSAARTSVSSSSGKIVGCGSGSEKEGPGRVALTGRMDSCMFKGTRRFQVSPTRRAWSRSKGNVTSGAYERRRRRARRLPRDHLQIARPIQQLQRRAPRARTNRSQQSSGQLEAVISPPDRNSQTTQDRSVQTPRTRAPPSPTPGSGQKTRSLARVSAGSVLVVRA